MSWLGSAVIGSAVIGAGSSLIAGRQQQNAANRATDTQLQMFNQTREDQAPYREAGVTALGDIASRSDFFNHQFSPEDLKTNLAPNYEFMRKQGEGGIANMANAMGGLGGNSLTAISKWNNDYAQNAYQQAFQNYSSQRTDIFNRLASIAGIGQTASSAGATGAPSFAGGIANTITGAGNAGAAGTVGAANAVTGAANNFVGWNYLNRLTGGSGSLPGGPT